MMQPPAFLIGTLPNGERRWAAIDAAGHHLQPRIGDIRFAAYLAPFPCEAAARHALAAEGATNIQPEVRGRRGR